MLLIVHDFMRQSSNTSVLLNKKLLAFLKGPKSRHSGSGCPFTELCCLQYLHTTQRNVTEILLLSGWYRRRPPYEVSQRDLGWDAAIDIRFEFRLMSSLCSIK
jgi:hypothetical protein